MSARAVAKRWPIGRLSTTHSFARLLSFSLYLSEPLGAELQLTPVILTVEIARRLLYQATYIPESKSTEPTKPK
jgi:hypothetical protein